MGQTIFYTERVIPLVLKYWYGNHVHRIKQIDLDILTHKLHVWLPGMFLSAC